VTVVESLDDLAEWPVTEVETDHGRPDEPVGLDLTPDRLDQGADSSPDLRVASVGGRSEARQRLAAESSRAL
jgi:hypothetical protein